MDARAVENYHDPALDGLINQSTSLRRNSIGQRKSSGHERRRSLDSASGVPMRMPAAPEVPQGPPISYRGGPVADMPPQRSFSQRAKGRPYAREAFGGDFTAPPESQPGSRQRPAPEPYAENPPMPRASAQSQPEPRSRPAPEVYTDSQPRPVRSQGPKAPQLQVDTRGGDARQTRTRKADSRRPEAYELGAQTNGTPRVRDAPSNGRGLELPSSAVELPAGFQNDDYDDDDRRDWAPDRSPLQKLEVTLNDISKEEKRSRVQEAEMLLRDSQAKRVGSEGSKSRSRGTDAPPAAMLSNVKKTRGAPSQASSTDNTGMVRNLSSTHRNRLQHSTIIENHKPDARRLSGENRGFDYSAPQPREPATQGMPTSPRAASNRDSYEYAAPPERVSSQSRRRSTDEPNRRQPEPRADAQPQTAARGVPSNITRAIDMHQSEPLPRFSDDAERGPSMVERERNASHKAALAKLTGAAAPAAVARSGSRKLQKAPPQNQRRDLVRDPNTIQQQAYAANQRQVPDTGRPFVPDQRYTQTPPQQINQDASGGAPGDASLMTSSPMSQRIPSDPTKTRQRKSSVSFKEPAVRRPADEWREAKTAKLCLSDFASGRGETAKEGEPYKPWWEDGPDGTRRRGSRGVSGGSGGYDQRRDAIDDQAAEFSPRLYVRCGPLLRYTGMKKTQASADGKTSAGEIWRGSVMIVTQDTHSSYQTPPVLRLFSRPKDLIPPPPSEITGEELAPEYVDPLAGLTKVSRIGRALYVRPVDHLTQERDLSQVENDDGLFESSPSFLDTNGAHAATTAATNKRTSDRDGESMGAYQEVEGARLYADPDRDVTFWRFNIEVELGDQQQHVVYRINRGTATGFWVPARGQTMNIMFHSCNGFSASVNPNLFSGPDPLWRDVLNVHQTRPFHVMIGGGDQIYNDRVMIETEHFAEWTHLRNPAHKHHAPFTNEMKEELETFYLNRYAMWFSQGLFGMANSQIPMVNVWDDHDIIDGYGSYPDNFMKTPVFSGIGNVAFKYYMLFQHQSVSEETTKEEPSWVLGHEPGPYIHQPSRSLFMHMGKHVAFLGVDCRTERMRDEILSIRTFDLLLERCRKEIVEEETKHLIVLLGVPIAYPRLVWLENVLTSKAMDPIKALGRAGIVKGGFLNKFDGGVEILDDLDDHWTASHHKQERNDLIKDLQDLAAEKSVRITILGGDVHLGAIGQFHSNPKLKIPKDHDHRYMPNVISSAIVNTPPPDMMADIMNKRNKVHHLDKYTDENMIPMFTHDVDHKKRNNHHLLPRRNWCSIREYIPGHTPPPTPPESESEFSEEDGDGQEGYEGAPKRRFSFSKGVRPGDLLRRLSSRRAPPSSYKDSMDTGAGQQFRSASYDGSQANRNDSFGQGRSTSNSRRASSAEPKGRASSVDRNSSGGFTRPGMLRRPTNMSEKAARKGNIPALDAEGNEIDVNDHVNLEGGLDIVLNVEINQKDPSGITTPYRLLVPALWYDGSSDREKLESAAGVHRKPTLLNRMGVGGKRQQKSGQKQGAGNWGQDTSDVESYSGDEGNQKQTPRRRFSLFGNRAHKQEYYSDEDSGAEDESQDKPGFAQPPQPNAIQRQVSAPAAPAQAGYNQPRQTESPQVAPTTAQRGYNDSYAGLSHRGTANVPQRGYNEASQAPTQRSVAEPARPGYDQPQTTAPSAPSARAPTAERDVLYDTSNPPPSQQWAQSTRAPQSQKSAPRRSLTITSQQPRAAPRSVSDNYPIQQPPTPSKSAYQTQSKPRQSSSNSSSYQPQRTPQQYSTNSPLVSATPPQAPTPIESRPQRRLSKQERVLGIGSESNDPPQRTLSKQERLLGIGSGSNEYPQPGQQPLRGNGIIGNDYNKDDNEGGRRAGSYNENDNKRGRGYGPSSYPSQNAPQGYGGDDANKGSRRRSGSLKRMRNWLDGGKRNDENEDAYAQSPSADNVSSTRETKPKMNRGNSFQKAKGWLSGRSSGQQEEYYSDDGYDENPRAGNVGGNQDREAKPKMNRGSSFQKAKGWLSGRSRGQEEDYYSDDYTDEEGEHGDAAGDRSGAAGGGARGYGQNTNTYAGNSNAQKADRYSEQGSKPQRGGTFKKAKGWLNGRSKGQEEDYYSDDYTDEKGEQSHGVGGGKSGGAPSAGTRNDQNANAYAGSPNAQTVDKYSEQDSQPKRGGTFRKAKEWLSGRSRGQNEEDYYSDDYTDEEDQGIDVGGSKYTGGPGGGSGRGGFR